MNVRVSRPGTVINNNGICSPECDWIIKTNIDPPILLFHEQSICSMFHEVLKINYKTGDTLICDRCKALKDKEIIG